jgi:RND family efflux transporter MFP subunit
MSHIIHRTSLVTASALVLLLPVLAGCKEEVAAAPETVRPVKVMQVAPAAASRQLVYSGTVKARVESALGFRVPGKIVERKVDIGDRVTPGQVVARIDNADLRLALQSADAQVVGAKARKDIADLALERARTLYGKGFTAKAALERAELEADQAAAALDQALSNRDQAANQQAYAELVADAAGIVTEIRADAGQVVASGTPVVVIARDGEKEVAVAVPEQEIRHFAPGKTVEIGYWADPAIHASGTVREIAGSADASSRTFAVRVTLPDDPRVRLGQTAVVTATVPIADPAVTVPLSALDGAGTAARVWVVDRAGATVAARAVEIGPVTADGVRVVSGLKPGEMVVTAGTQFMLEGKKVKLPETPLATAALAAARPE